MSPESVDTRLADLYARQCDAQDHADRERARADKWRAKGHGWEDQAERFDREADRWEDEAARLDEQAQPPRHEYDRRPWPRAFAVTDGHVHASMDCPTCNRDGHRTRFVWVTEYSGATQHDIVDAAGERACTVCYPDAPTDTLARPTRIHTPEEQKAAEKPSRRTAAARRDAGAVTGPDGRPLHSPGPSGRDVSTLPAAKTALTDAVGFTRGAAHGDAPTAAVIRAALDASDGAAARAMVDAQLRWCLDLSGAIAAATGDTPDQVLAAAHARRARRR